MATIADHPVHTARLKRDGVDFYHVHCGRCGQRLWGIHAPRDGRPAYLIGIPVGMKFELAMQAWVPTDRLIRQREADYALVSSARERGGQPALVEAARRRLRSNFYDEWRRRGPQGALDAGVYATEGMIHYNPDGSVDSRSGAKLPTRIVCMGHGCRALNIVNSPDETPDD